MYTFRAGKKLVMIINDLLSIVFEKMGTCPLQVKTVTHRRNTQEQTNMPPTVRA